MGGGGMGRGMGGRGGEYSMSGGAGAEEMTPETEPYMKSIILQGTVYIFNPPTEETAADPALATAGME